MRIKTYKMSLSIEIDRSFVHNELTFVTVLASIDTIHLWTEWLSSMYPSRGGCSAAADRSMLSVSSLDGKPKVTRTTHYSFVNGYPTRRITISRFERILDPLRIDLSLVDLISNNCLEIPISDYKLDETNEIITHRLTLNTIYGQ